MKKLKVLIAVRGGIATVVACPENIEVDLRDFDNNRDTFTGETTDDIQEFTPQEIEEAENGYGHDPEPQGTEKELEYAKLCRKHKDPIGAVRAIQRAFPGLDLAGAKFYYDTKL